MEAIYSLSKSTSSSDDDGLSELRRGPWTAEEDSLLIHYISCHGEGRWNLLAQRSGLKRTGKSCRLRWLNYLKPDVKRGNLSPEEQLLILELHSKWGNRWSKIAQYLPGRTDNEIKNYWRTRVQKQARHLKIDSNSREFQELIRTVWMPRLLHKVQEEPVPMNPCPDSSPAPKPLAGATNVPCGFDNRQIFNSPPSMSFSSSNSESTNIISSLPQISEFSENPMCPFIANVNNFYGHFQSECYNVDMSTGYVDIETLSSAAAPVSRIGMAEQNNWLFSDDITGHCLWSNLDEFWQVKQPKERYT